MTLYRVASLCLAVAFGATGLLFLSLQKAHRIFNPSPMVACRRPLRADGLLPDSRGRLYVRGDLPGASMFRHPGNPQFRRPWPMQACVVRSLLALFLLQDSY